ncbi:MAG: hypothetical protein QG599_2897 [Pseudomonadota bacterium]|nr:hypothetical protein [Pseudomonadota bacterium]
MASYKGVEVKDGVRALLPHMPLIEEYRETLQTLQAVWDNLNLLGQMSGTTAEIGQMREAFSNLTGELLNNLAERTLVKRAQEMKAKSQVAVDILVRNLFERTADIGFLSTDDVIRRVAAGEPFALQPRFREYVRKYSVYEDVVLLATDGRILARLTPNDRVTAIHDTWVYEALQTSAAYVEAFGPSDLFHEPTPSLIYAYRVTSAHGEILGVLALCFRFADEVQRIFRDLAQVGGSGVIALLDTQGRVIASSDPWQVPVGAELTVASNQLQRLRFAGRHYLAFASDTQGYQGYMGPSWRGLMMIPVDQAFDIHDQETIKHDVDPRLLASVMVSGRAFPENLQAIPRQANAIQRNLSRAVWNGSVRQSASAASINANFSKILLWEISRVGMNMREVFTRSIGDLQATVMSSLLADSQFFAGLAIDIMDRNLYERANDCRWWALDVTIRRLMGSHDLNRRRDLEQVIRYINSLYTVYDNILLFDTTGKVAAVSNVAYSVLVGSTLREPWIGECLALHNSQSYTVSHFTPTHLYASRPTYIYLAAVRSSDDSQVVGGIAISFDSAPQFSAMLYDALPREASGEPVAGSFAVFVDATAHIIASSNNAYRPGEVLPTLPPELLAPPPEGCSRLIAMNGQVMAVGARRSSGYREYKGIEDAYRNEVTAVVFMPLGAYNPEASVGKIHNDLSSRRSNVETGVATCEIATFHLGNHWLGLPISEVIEAIELADTACLANAPKAVYGATIYRGRSLPIYSLDAALGLPQPTDFGADRQIIVVRGKDTVNFGILVDALGEILEVLSDDIENLSNVYVGVASVLASVVKTSPRDSDTMLILLSVASMSEHLRGRQIVATLTG